MFIPVRCSMLMRCRKLASVMPAFCLLLLLAQMGFAQTLVSTGSSWKYLDNGSDQGTAWRTGSFNDSAWSTGNAQLGYGDSDEATILSYGPDANNKYVTTWFRKSFTVTNAAAFNALTLRLLRDDGAVVYLNGTEIVRSNLPTGTISYNTLASVVVGGADESTFYSSSVNASLLVEGTNVIAVEVHQSAANSSDVSFDLELTGTVVNPTLVAKGSSWRYLDNGTDQGTVWQGTGFNDSTWNTGNAQLGYGDADEATIVSYGPDANNKFVTTYFRQSFSVANPAAFLGLTLSLLRDDGAVVYINGVEVYRSNLPTGTISYNTFASTAIGGADESTFLTTSISSSLLISGTNVIAVELHQSAANSSDISFDLELRGNTGTTTATVTRGPYLQLGTPNSLIVRWRTDVATDSRVRYGSSATTLTQAADDASSTTEHSVTLTGLQANTTYFYSVGSTSASLAGGDASHFFVTPPVAGTAKPTRIWVLGDAGVGTTGQSSVRDAYANFTGTRYTDLIMMLGDNAYQNGTDTEYQAAVFNMYPNFLRQSVLWSTIGNHDTAQSTNPAPTIPYYQIFTLPQNAEAGGLASGTEDYYSFDYGNIHFVCLDSMTSSRAAGSAMLTWLQSDLANNTKPWLIAFWHHPPYSKGSHDSDTETTLIEMRQNVLPILEAHGVDLVLSGHSHSYERSFLIDGHYGSSSTFTSSMKKDGGSGQPTGTGAYTKPTNGIAAHEGTVYAVPGSAGQISGGTLNHPAMFVSLNQLGSMVLDVDGSRLDAKFIRETGAIADNFTLLKGGTPNTPPTVSITSPTSGATFTAPATITIQASASDSNGTISKVDFYQGTILLGTDTTAPYEFIWSNVAAGSYSLTARAFDNASASTTSGAISLTVSNPPVPLAPGNLSASAIANTQIRLTWTDNATNETGFSIERSTNGTTFSQIAVVGANITTYTNTGLQRRRTYYYRVRAYNAAGNSAWSNTASTTTP